MYIRKAINFSRACPTRLLEPSASSAPRFKSLVWFAVGTILLGVFSSGLVATQSIEKEGYITVRLLDANNGKPLKGVSLGFLVWEGKGRAVELSNAITNADGRIVLRLPSPVPERVGITYSPNEVRSCSDEAFPTVQILKTGIVAEYKCDDGKLKRFPTRTAGELVIFTRRVSLLERLRREIP